VTDDDDNDDLKTTPRYGDDAFLGGGTFGFVFRVKRLDDEHSQCLALKIWIV
jgi:hypothetical protein